MSYIPERFPRYKGYALPRVPCLIEDVNGHMDKIRKFESRKSDILLCTFPKSGTNWINEIIVMMIKGKAEYGDQYKGIGMLELMTDFTPLESLSDTSTRIINTHVPIQDLPQKHIQNGYKVVHMYRNPKSVAVSKYNHMLKMKAFRGNDGINDFPKNWAFFIENYCRCSDEMYTGWFNYEKGFEKAKENGTLKNVFTVQYEQLRKDPLPILKDLAMFLNVSLSDDIIEEINKKCSFEQMSTTGQQAKENTKKIQSLSVDGTNPFFRKGTISDWKNWFTVAQDEAFTRLIETELKDSKLKLIYD